MKVLLADNYNSYNAGDAAILEGMLAALRPLIPDATFTVTSSYPDVAESVHDLPAVLWTPRTLTSRRALAWWLLRSGAWALVARRAAWAARICRLTEPERRLMEAYRDADLVIGVGGAYLRSGYRFTPFRLWHMLLAKWLGKPVMLYAQSIGPFEPGPVARWAGAVLRRLDVITVRDEPSLEELARLGVRGPHIELTADAALALPSAPPALPEAAVASPAAHLPQPGPRVGVSVLHWHKFRRGSFAGYVAELAAALDAMLDDWAGSVTFLSTTVAPAGRAMDVSGTARDDVAAARDVAAAMRHADRTTIAIDPLPLEALRARIAGFDLWIGTRMHSCLFATTAGVPAVGIGYEPKVGGYFRQLEMAEYVVDIEDFRAAELAGLAARAWEQRAVIRVALARRVPELQERSRANAVLAAELAAPMAAAPAVERATERTART